MRKQHWLVIVFNQFYPEKKHQYVELVLNKDGDLLEEKTLSRKPTAKRFDRVLETGEGSYNDWNRSKAVRVYGHRLEKTA